MIRLCVYFEARYEWRGDCEGRKVGVPADGRNGSASADPLRVSFFLAGRMQMS